LGRRRHESALLLLPQVIALLAIRNQPFESLRDGGTALASAISCSQAIS
jgi:hypothetical protein